MTTLAIKCVPYTRTATADASSIAPVSVTLKTRAALPYPPGKVKVGADYWPDGKTYTAGDLVLSWAHRIRTAQAGMTVVQQDAGNVTGTIEGTYKVEVLVGGVVKRTVTALTGTSWTYTAAMQTADAVLTASDVQFRLTPVNGILSGTARTTDVFHITQA